jgi:hypothetical protein
VLRLLAKTPQRKKSSVPVFWAELWALSVR